MSTQTPLPISPVIAHLPRPDLRQMLRLVRLLFRLSQSTDYRQMVMPQLPEVAQFDPGHAALMMGYDFHLTPSGPKLIEVNTNAGGAYFAWLSEQQPQLLSATNLVRYSQRLWRGFAQEWTDFSGVGQPSGRVVIVDEDPEQQPLFTEMRVCSDWLREGGLDVHIADPGQLDLQSDGLYLQGEKVDMIYNRHCDFFLEEDALAPIRSAYLDKKVCLSPNPFAYGLLADKRRMILWSNAKIMQSLKLEESELKLLKDVVPDSRLLADCATDDLWARRKTLIFKPVTRFGSRGVLPGKGITRNRYNELDAQTTLVQQLIPPSLEQDNEGHDFKVDFRLYVYRDHLVGIAARLYQGQVTNLRTAGGGFAPVRLI